MSQYAILLTGEARRPQAVRLQSGPDGLILTDATGACSELAWWRLFRLQDEGTTHRFARVDQRHWELRVTAGADRDLLSRVGRRPFARLFNLLRRLHLIKAAFGLLLLLSALVEYFPAEWAARALPRGTERQLVDSWLSQHSADRCSREGGEEAVEKLLVRLDTDFARKVRIAALDESAFVVTAAPANMILLTRAAVQSVDAETLAALLAHQLSHLRHDDARVALVRHEGAWGIWGAVLKGQFGDGLRMRYTGLQERRADIEAMAMLRRAQIPLRPAATFFDQVRLSRAEGTFLAYEYRDFHFGIDQAARRWARAADEQERAGPVPPVLSQAEADALFNFCWAGPLSHSRSGGGSREDPPPPGHGGIGSPAP